MHLNNPLAAAGGDEAGGPFTSLYSSIGTMHIIGVGMVDFSNFFIIYLECKYIQWQQPSLPLTWLPSSSLSIHSPWQAVGRSRHLLCLRRHVVAVHEELRKDSKIQHKRTCTSNQPAQVDQNVLAVDVGSLARLAVAALVPVAVGALAADWLESEDAEDESQVSEAGEEEEQSVQAFGRLAASVEQNLGHAAAEVKDCADVAKDLAPEREVQGRRLVVCVGAAVFVVRLGLGSGGAEVVACDACDDDEYNGCAVEQNSLEHGARLRWFRACSFAQFLGLRVHRSSRRQHGSVKVVQVIAVRGLRASAVGTQGSLELFTSIAVAHERRTL